MKLLFAALLAFLTVGAQTTYAIDFGHLRPLQKGPIGDAPAFSEAEDIEAEAALEVSRAFGNTKIDDNPDLKSTSASLAVRTRAGASYAASDSFVASINADLTVGSDFNEDRTRVSPTAKFDAGHYRHELSGYVVFKGKPFVAGGGLSLLVVGSETKIFNYADQKFDQTADSAAMPVLRVFGGFQSKAFMALLGVRAFSQGESVVEAEDATGTEFEYDIVRRSPGEVHADAKLTLANTELGLSLAYVLTGQASESEDEFSLEFEEVGNRRIRRTGEGRRSKNHIRAGIGARYTPSKLIGILGALNYIQPSYSEERFASLEAKNLGGLRLDVGTDINLKPMRAFLQVGYQLDSTAEYTEDQADRGALHIVRTQKLPIEQGSEVKVTQGSFQVVAGAGITL